MLRGRLQVATTLPATFLAALNSALDRAVALAERVANKRQETLARQAATALYDVSSAVLLAWEGSRRGTDARRALLSRFVLTHRLTPVDPLAPEEAAWEAPAIAALLDGKRLDLPEVVPMLA
jgi:hypothetical protein